MRSTISYVSARILPTKGSLIIYPDSWPLFRRRRGELDASVVREVSQRDLLQFRIALVFRHLEDDEDAIGEGGRPGFALENHASETFLNPLIRAFVEGDLNLLAQRLPLDDLGGLLQLRTWGSRSERAGVRAGRVDGRAGAADRHRVGLRASRVHGERPLCALLADLARILLRSLGFALVGGGAAGGHGARNLRQARRVGQRVGVEDDRAARLGPVDLDLVLAGVAAVRGVDLDVVLAGRETGELRLLHGLAGVGRRRHAADDMEGVVENVEREVLAFLGRLPLEGDLDVAGLGHVEDLP